MDYYLGPAEYGEYQRYALMQEPMLIKSTVLWLLQEQSIEGDSITITGSRPFRAWGKEYKAPLYSAFDYFRLTKADVQQWLLDNPRRTRSKNLQR